MADSDTEALGSGTSISSCTTIHRVNDVKRAYSVNYSTVNRLELSLCDCESCMLSNTLAKLGNM